MYLKSCCALFLLALVACQAAPSFEKSSNEAETFAKTDIKLEGTGAEKDRAKKSATTFCVEVRSGRPEQVPCRPEVRPQEIIHREEKPVVIVQPIPIPAPAPIIEYPKQPIVIQPQPQPQPRPQPQPSQDINWIQQQQSSQTTNINYPQNHAHHQPAPSQAAPAPAPQIPQIPSIINIVPPAPAAPCDKPTQQPQIHTVHVIRPQETPRPSIQEPVRDVRPQQKITFFEPRPICRTCNGVIQPQRPSGFIQPSQIIDIPQYEQDSCRTEEETYACNCRQENRTPYSRFTKIQDPRMAHPSGATLNSMPYRSSMISTESDSNIMSNQPMFFERTREMEGRHKKHYIPLNFNVQFPIIRGSDDTPKYYQQSYAPSYPYFNPTSYTLPSFYGSTYGSYGSYGTTYPTSYDGQSSASNPSSVIVNAGGPFYSRNSQDIDSSPRSNNEDLSKETLLSSATEMIDASNNPKRETDISQLKNEQKEITRTEKENIKEAIL